MHNSRVMVIHKEDYILLRIHNILHHMVIILHHRLQEATLVQVGSKGLQHQCMGIHFRAITTMDSSQAQIMGIQLLHNPPMVMGTTRLNMITMLPHNILGTWVLSQHHMLKVEHIRDMDQSGKPPIYGMQGKVPYSQPYGQPRPSQPGEVPYQGPGYTPIQQSYPSYGGTTDGYGHTASASAYPPQGSQPVAGYGQPGTQPPPAYPQVGPAGGYGSYPTAQSGYTEQAAASNATYGYQGTTDPAYGAALGPAAYPATTAAQSSYAQPSQTQPAYDQSAGYGNVTAAAGYGKSVSPQPAYPQYDSSQIYGAHR